MVVEGKLGPKSYLRSLSVLLALLYLVEAWMLDSRADDAGFQFIVYGIHSCVIGLFLINIRKTGSELGSLSRIPLVCFALSFPPVLSNMAFMVHGFAREVWTCIPTLMVVGLPCYLFTYRDKANETN